MKNKIVFRVELFEEDDQFVGFCPELNISSFGDSPKAAESSLKEAVGLFVEQCEDMGTLDEVLEEAGFRRVDAPEDRWVSREPLKLATAEL